MLYFAYGSNMSYRRLRLRIRSCQSLGIARLARHRLAFHKISENDGSGKCDAFYTGEQHDVVIGVLYQIDKNDLPILDRFEGQGYGYRRDPVIVQTDSGNVVEAQTYLALRIDPELLPYRWYKNHVLQGAIENRLPDNYIEIIENLPTLPDPDPLRTTREMAIYSQ